MKIGCVLTTINVPYALAVYAKAAAYDTHFFVVGDRKTPDIDVVTFLETNNIPHSYFGYDWQAKLGYKCHELIGENSIQLRNIGFLEALRWGADLIVSIDDDNLVLNDLYFDHHEFPFLQPFHGAEVLGVNGWFDVGQMLAPVARHRGFPIQIKPNHRFGPVWDAKVGVNAGICLGDPDISAIDRISQSPMVQNISEFLRAGVVVHPETHTVWNSQNTAVRRELIPAWGMVPFVGRMDDIYASLICHRVMREYGYVTHFGVPMILQQRNEHDLVRDLRGEIHGYSDVVKLAEALDHILLRGKSIVEDCKTIWQTLGNASFIPGESAAAMLAYVRDCETVL